jgi:pimeloyl-ACP methyl ester carboxylesterase
VIEVGYFAARGNELAYSCAIPDSEPERTGIVFVHAADGNRLGPHRMFVELADSFNRLGYPTLRFDLSGCGDSSGSVSREDITPEVVDVVEAVRFFEAKANLESVILFGISRGALVCYSSMVRYSLSLSGMILLSMPVSSGRAALKSFWARLKEYICKAKDPRRLWKLLTGKADYAQIWQTLLTALKLKQRYAPVEKDEFASKCPILFIYGAQDPVGDESREYYTERCRENDLPWDCHFIEGANHSYFHYKWKEQILDLSKRWLQNRRSR